MCDDAIVGVCTLRQQDHDVDAVLRAGEGSKVPGAGTHVDGCTLRNAEELKLLIGRIVDVRTRADMDVNVAVQREDHFAAAAVNLRGIDHDRTLEHAGGGDADRGGACGIIDELITEKFMDRRTDGHLIRVDQSGEGAVLIKVSRDNSFAGIDIIVVSSVFNFIG